MNNRNQSQLFTKVAYVALCLPLIFAQVDWQYTERIDSHESYPIWHAAAQTEIWDRFAHLLDVLSTITHHITGKSLFPHHVTVVGLTEFSRLPYLNATVGKDHDIFDNSLVLAGRGVRGGQSLGAHHLFVRDARRRQSQLSGCHIDYRTGEVVTNGYYNTGDTAAVQEDPEVRLIRPENVLRTLAEIFKVDPGAMRLFPKDTPVLPLIVG